MNRVLTEIDILSELTKSTMNRMQMEIEMLSESIENTMISIPDIRTNNYKDIIQNYGYEKFQKDVIEQWGKYFISRLAEIKKLISWD